MPGYYYVLSLLRFSYLQTSIVLLPISQFFAAKSSTLENIRKKNWTLPGIRMETRAGACSSMPENVRQDVKTQSHRKHFTWCRCKYHFYLGGFHAYLLKYNGFQKALYQYKSNTMILLVKYILKRMIVKSYRSIFFDCGKKKLYAPSSWILYSRDSFYLLWLRMQYLERILKWQCHAETPIRQSLLLREGIVLEILLLHLFVKGNMVRKGGIASAVFTRRAAPELTEPSGKVERIVETGLFRDLLAGVRIVLQKERCPFHPKEDLDIWKRRGFFTAKKNPKPEKLIDFLRKVCYNKTKRRKSC